MFDLRKYSFSEGFVKAGQVSRTDQIVYIKYYLNWPIQYLAFLADLGCKENLHVLNKDFTN